MADLDRAQLQDKAEEVARLLRLLGNARRLLIVCKLAERREANVTTLAAEVGISQSALSQHLARMREDGLVAFRRDSQTIWYRIADTRVEELLGLVERLFCRPTTKKGKTTVSLPTISPEQARRMVDDGAVIIDIREADEHLRERIPGAQNAPLSRLETLSIDSRPVIFHCRSGARTGANAGRLASVAAACDAYIIEGGIEAWRKSGLPVARDTRRPIEIMRQVQIVAGSLVLTGAILAATVDGRFVALSGVVGAGLVFAGISGWCGMAKVLALLPWNRQPA